MTLLLDGPNYLLALGLIAWITLQASILFVQDRIGPRAFIPEYFYPTRYDYHPVISFSGDDETPAPSSVKVDSKECAIYMQVPIKGRRSLRRQQEALRKVYMVTPCLHVFHSDCLGRWMEMKMECPVCRKELPPP
ncbi:hypothetical protein BCR33DRAFT_716481 [Rhizoclosmatium globosum]|uniref:RING-type E3 ubiquitin transferase n=1 Tax=Rhizoclosmatium globosum TaxID=329046 RepID=A0A1Y2CDN2_9FUNG|nr:hypothetical protein BCR33DRAFT_716481 [Rhizoclosmatium globosum]|eukprot:ORY45143.1 hypothetical protein BCR33DRAFT_716481 [Rhizoclosmatium globosum]